MFRLAGGHHAGKILRMRSCGKGSICQQCHRLAPGILVHFMFCRQPVVCLPFLRTASRYRRTALMLCGQQCPLQTSTTHASACVRCVTTAENCFPAQFAVQAFLAPKRCTLGGKIKRHWHRPDALKAIEKGKREQVLISPENF